MNRKTKVKLILGLPAISGIFLLASTFSLSYAMTGDDAASAEPYRVACYEKKEEEQFNLEYEDYQKSQNRCCFPSFKMRYEIGCFSYKFPVCADTPLIYSICRHTRYPSMCEKLIEKGADVNQTNSGGFSPLHVALLRGYYDIAKLLINKGANIHAKCPIFGQKAIHLLVDTDDENFDSVYELLLKKGASPEEKDELGNTAYIRPSI